MNASQAAPSGTVDRLSRTFGWFVAGPKAFKPGAKFLLARGYR
jgi:hypothetical protein